MDLDEDGRIKNLFWADARSRAAYEEFGDVVTFDTTYLTNKSWLACVNGHAPIGILTDQDRAMQNAIEIVFPNTRHRWCLWHIMKKLPQKLSGYVQYESIKFSIQNAVYDALSTAEFELSWTRLIEKYNLGDSEWLQGLYNERKWWVPTFLNDSFWAGMSSTQRSKSMNAFFKDYVTPKTSLKQFVEQYEHALRAKVDKESQEYYNSFNASIPCVTKYKVEKQFQECYTTAKFKEFQEEIKGKLYCSLSLITDNGVIEEYRVKEYMVGESERQGTFIVTFVGSDCDIKCNCRLFESRGIVCRHCLAILVTVKAYHALPEKYILRRWRKDVKRCHTKVKIAYSNWEMNPENERAGRLCNKFYKVVDLAIENEDKTKFVKDSIDLLFEQLQIGRCASSSKGFNTLSVNRVNVRSSGASVIPTTEGNIIPRSPFAIRNKGRPPSKRKQSIVEKVVKRKRRKISQGSKSATKFQKDSNLSVVSKNIDVDLDTSRDLSSEGYFPTTKDDASICVPWIPINLSDLPYGINNLRNTQVSRDRVHDMINESMNPQRDYSALQNLQNQTFEPFWSPSNNE